MPLNGETVARWLRRVQGLRVAVFGDVILERIILGEVVGMTEEGPTPLVEIRDTQHELSGAAFAAELAAALGATVELAGILGRDREAELAIQLLRERKVGCSKLQRRPEVPTRLTTRIVAHVAHRRDHEILRTRRPRVHELPPEWSQKLRRDVLELASESDVVLIVEQAEGTVPAALVRELSRDLSKHRRLVVGDLQTLGMQGAGLDGVVLNEKEARHVLSGVESPADQTPELAQRIRERIGARSVLVTRGPRPAVLAAPGELTEIPVEAVPVYDVTGAGETVSTAYALGLAAGFAPREAAELALQAASFAVTLPGRAVITPQELERHVRRRTAALQAEKIVSLDRLRQIVAEAKRAGRKVVWTNGCFDLLHVGHILYLEKARQLGDLLIVGLNSDASVRATKGPARPIVDESQRARLLASLTCTDYVVIFDDPSPKQIIAELQPDVYVKGGDYTIDTINQEERRIVESYGGQIALLPGVEGMSTTELIRRIIAAYGGEQTTGKP